MGVVVWNNFCNLNFDECLKNCRSSHVEVIGEKSVLEKFAKITGKHMCWNFFYIGLRACNSIKKKLQHRCFHVNFTKFLRIPIEEHLGTAASGVMQLHENVHKYHPYSICNKDLAHYLQDKICDKPD